MTVWVPAASLDAAIPELESALDALHQAQPIQLLVLAHLRNEAGLACQTWVDRNSVLSAELVEGSAAALEPCRVLLP